ncbi:hypothetical protein EC991_002227 [Linnemannia zychae]|nr:hypothetical protein EC991_002227 [Linnemannia zychae]
MAIGTIWVDIESDTTCNNWNYGPQGNSAKAKELINAIRASGFKFGIYSSPGEWGNIFGSRDVVLDKTVPLWFATFNNVRTLKMDTPFGGWTTAVGHQYTDTSASGQAHGQGSTKAIIRGYEQACSTGGRVDPNFVPSYNNARAAGYTEIDMYWFPCAGTNNKCKAFSAQLSEIASTLQTNKMMIGTVWVNIQRDPACRIWNYGPQGNLAKAKELINAIKASGLKFGIYSSTADWGDIFGSLNVVLDNTVPLWFSAFNNVQNLKLDTPFGGWTTAVGHQFTNQSPSGLFNLSVFA